MIVFVDRETSSSIKRIFFSKSIFLYVEEVFLLVYIVTLCDWNVICFNKMNKIVLLGKLIKDPELKTIENGEKKGTNAGNRK